LSISERGGIFMEGLIRKVDALGRIMIPQGLRNSLSLGDFEPVQIRIEERDGKTVVILKKHHPGCIFCNELEHYIEFLDKKVCPNCLEKISRL
jgi:transcriptional pleiotropic regulator of transition state genes